MQFFSNLIEFFTFGEPNVKLVFWGSLVLCATAGLIGTFTFLRKRSLLGDVISHSVLPGICLAFILAREKNPVYLISGAVVTGWISTYLVDFITSKSKIKTDTAIALVLSVFFGVGILLLTSIQHSGIGAQSGLDRFIFGSAAAINKLDVRLFVTVGSLILGLVILFYRGFYLISFDEDYARAIGYPVNMLKLLLSIATVLTVAIGVQAVGVVLMSALLITPAAAARFWAQQVRYLLLFSVLIASLSGILGAAISYTSKGMPTGPWIVVVASVIALLSAIFGFRKGLLLKAYNRYLNNRKILKENILKAIFKLDHENGISIKELNRSLDMPYRSLRRGFWILRAERKLTRENGMYKLTEDGARSAREVVRKHRLWEMYLSTYLNLKEDHVHDDAEGIEHVLTPEIEKELMELLDMPERDPHDSEIPYD